MTVPSTIPSGDEGTGPAEITGLERQDKTEPGPNTQPDMRGESSILGEQGNICPL